MIETKKTCDRCKTESLEPAFELFEITVSSRLIAPTSTGTSDRFPKQHWCRACMNDTALLGITDKLLEERRQASLAPPKPVTFEDMVYEIAGEAAAEAIHNSRG